VDKDTRLGLLASAILDGTPVDWDTADATAAASERGVIRRLQIVAEIAALHRQPDEASALVGSDATLPRVRGAFASWGHLRLLESIGRGTFGEVYRAWDTYLDREVALKLLRTTPALDDPSASLSDPMRVVNEGRLLARVRHPNVITVYGAEPRDDTVGIWMEFIRGRTLHQIVEQQGPLSAREAAGLAADLCRALSAVHGAGLLHRDVTARNVMREDGGRVVLMDFGAGHERHDGALPPGNDVTGTPLYMAPELFVGGRADVRSDIYSLGVLMFYLVTGSFPVTGRSLAELREAHRAGARTRLRDLRADLHGPFVRAVEMAVAADPAERFQTVGAMEAALERAVVDRRQAASPPSLPRWRLIASLAAVSVIAAGFTWALRPGHSDAPPAGLTPPVAVAELTSRRVSTPDGLLPFSNPSDDGRYVAGMIYESGDAAIIDLATGDYRRLHVGRADGSDGYASWGALSPDARFVAVDWYNGRDASLRVVATDGTAARVLVDPPGDVSAYQWSRDGSLILAALGREDVNVLALVAARDGGIRVLRTLGSAVPRHAALSDDGRYVVYDYPERADSVDHDLYVLDAHTGDQWRLEISPGHDASPFWTPDGRAIVFESDRNRNPSLWMIPVANGRAEGAARLVKDNVGRVVLRGFTQSGALHYQLSAGFAEVYVAAVDGSAPRPQPISPRQALSNFYPVWSRDGRYIAYASERSTRGRELWVYDEQSGRESRVPVTLPVGRPYGWSADGRWILVSGPDDGRLYTVERITGRADLVATGVQRASAWGPAGILYDAGKRMVVHDAAIGRAVRTFDFSDPAIASVGRPPSLDGRSLITQHKDGRVALHDTSTGRARTWHDAGIVSLREHTMAPHTAAVAYVAARKDLEGDAWSLMLWGGSGEPREVLRVHEPGDHFRLVGWMGDGLHLLVIRWSFDAARSQRVGNETLWRVPTTGTAPVSTGLALAGLRDLSVHPDGEKVVFNAGFKKIEHWAIENLLPR
jgi:eukaryotic-like serine/threonine-protein kinase